MECLAQNSAPTVRSVFSSATALAPFSQNSAALRFLSDSGHAQPGQSKPPRWFSRSKDCAVRVTPACATARSSATITALTPAASVFGLWTSSSSSLMSATGAGCFPNFIVPTFLTAAFVPVWSPARRGGPARRGLRVDRVSFLSPLGEGLAFRGDGGVVAVAGTDHRLRGERQEALTDGGQDGRV